MPFGNTLIYFIFNKLQFLSKKNDFLPIEFIIEIAMGIYTTRKKEQKTRKIKGEPIYFVKLVKWGINLKSNNRELSLDHKQMGIKTR